MRYRASISLLLGLLALLLLITPTLAGGWVVVTLDTLPTDIRAGQPVALGFTLLQHGQHPVHEIEGQALMPYLEARNVAQGETLHIDAKHDGKVGHFVVEVTFPTEGEWEWEINPVPFAGRTTLLPVTVLPASAMPAPAPAQEPVDALGTLQPLLRASGLLLLLLAGLVFMTRRVLVRPVEFQPERSHP